jgi:hypothetical protein
MKIKESKRINKLVAPYVWAEWDQQLDLSEVADFTVDLDGGIHNICWGDAFEVGLNAQRGYDIGVDEAPIYRVDGDYGIYFFIGNEGEITKKLRQFIKENS